MTDLHHATATQSARISALDAKHLRGQIEEVELLELALLHLEPLHEGFRAADLLQQILAVNPHNTEAKVWLTFIWIYEFMDDDSLRRAVDLCDQVLAQSPPESLQAAALQLKAAALRNLGSRDVVRFVSASIALAPHWISNRTLLASAYSDQGDKSAEVSELRIALVNSERALESQDVEDSLFEKLITERRLTGTARLLRDQIRQMESRLPKS